MTSSRSVSLVLVPLAVLTILSCSKTEDSAPERRVFGAPPIISSVDKAEFFDPKAPISCDFTEVIVNEICYLGGITGLEAQRGGGWTLVDGKAVISDTDSLDPGVFIEGTYGEVIFKVNASDPDSTSAQNNILLVSASYVQPQSNLETSLVVFDDGSFSKFRNSQKVGPPGEKCEVNEDGSCLCSNATYDVTSGDFKSKDDIWTRMIALHEPRANPFLLDCIMRERGETLITAPAGTVFSFKLEAVDRQGNLTTWPEKLIAASDTKINEFRCDGDSCGCCILQFSGIDAQCSGLPGMLSPEFPDGLCKAF